MLGEYGILLGGSTGETSGLARYVSNLPPWAQSFVNDPNAMWVAGAAVVFLILVLLFKR
ncbi:MAG: hypothetical protein KJN60_02130 [Boseongicola sp.]|nr:hypothetical protein [Boseongicola sp.]